jgi:uncharacterized protein YhbP (UPF0306 family)
MTRETYVIEEKNILLIYLRKEKAKHSKLSIHVKN